MSAPSSVSTSSLAPPVTAPPMTAAEEAIMLTSTCTNIYVANLPPSADATLIRELFAPVGNVLHVKVLLDIATGVSRGIAFVMFDDLNTAKRACALRNKHVLDGSVLQVRLAERSAQHNSPGVHTRSRIVYIRNVPGPTTKETVRSYCEKNYGRVLEVQPHPQSCELGGPSPFNMIFVTFEQVDHACRCVEGVDGKVPFPLPYAGHPFTMAKMITEMSGEMRKSILLRRRGGSEEPPGSATSNNLSPVGMSLSPPAFGQQQQQPPQPQQQQLVSSTGGSIAMVAGSGATGSPQYVHISPQLFSLIPQLSGGASQGTPPASPANAGLAPVRLSQASSGSSSVPQPTLYFAGPPPPPPGAQPAYHPAPTGQPQYVFAAPHQPTAGYNFSLEPQSMAAAQGHHHPQMYYMPAAAPPSTDMTALYHAQQMHLQQQHMAHQHHQHHHQQQQQQQGFILDVQDPSSLHSASAAAPAPPGAAFLPGTHVPTNTLPGYHHHYGAAATVAAPAQATNGNRGSPQQVYLVPMNHPGGAYYATH